MRSHFFGVLKAGGTVVNYSPLDAKRVLEHKVGDSETDILVTLDLALLYPKMKGLLGATRLKYLVVGSLGGYSARPDAVRSQLQSAGLLGEVARVEYSLSKRTALYTQAARIRNKGNATFAVPGGPPGPIAPGSTGF